MKQHPNTRPTPRRGGHHRGSAQAVRQLQSDRPARLGRTRVRPRRPSAQALGLLRVGGRIRWAHDGRQQTGLQEHQTPPRGKPLFRSYLYPPLTGGRCYPTQRPLVPIPFV